MFSDGFPSPRQDESSGEPRSLRVGVVRRVPGTVFPAWQARCLRDLLDLDEVEVVLLVSDERTIGRGPSEVRRSPAPRQGGLLWGAYNDVWIRRRSQAIRPVALTDSLVGVPDVCLQNIDAIRAADLDVMLDLGCRPIPDEIAGMARHGLWSFRFGEPGTPRDGAAGLWETYRGDAVTQAALERLPAPGAPGTLLYQGYFKTVRYSFPRHRDAVLFGVANWPAWACKRILTGADLVPNPPDTPLTPRFQADTVPTNRQMIHLLGMTAWRFAAAACAALLRRDEWNVGIAEAPIDAFLQPGARPRIRWLPRAREGTFLADPFVAGHGDATAVMVEEFDIRTGKGRIAALAVQHGGHLAPPEPAIEASVHLSYPYPIEYAGQTYCIPEMHQSGEVCLYRATVFPGEWVRCAVLIAGMAAADATVFLHEGRWWLFCSDEADYPNTTLHAWYAAELHGPWTPHSANPLKTDVRSSRPAGTPFLHGDRLYRPAQDCSQTYGGAIVICHVQRLTPTEFVEEPVARVAPDRRGPYPHGLHTLSAWGQRTLIDGKRRRFIPWASCWRLRSGVAWPGGCG